MARRISWLFAILGWAYLEAQSPQDQKAAIAGTVLDSATGQPVPGALVVLGLEYGGAPGQKRRAVTDTSGRFSFEAGNARPWSLSVSRRGFRSENDSDVATVFLQDADYSAEVVRLVPLSTVTGRILSDGGEPVPGLAVHAVRINAVDGRRELREVSPGSVTDDQGEFRLWYLAPGPYYVKIGDRSETINAGANSMQFSDSEETYGQIYYPSAPGPETARIFHLGPGQTVSANFRLPVQKSYEVRGTITNPPGVRRLGVRLLKGGDPQSNRSFVGNLKGTFQVEDVTPGIYTLQVYTRDNGPVMSAEAQVDIPRDLAPVTLTLHKAADIHGHFEFKGASYGIFQLYIRPLDARVPPEHASEIQTDLDPQSGFSVAGLMPGRYALTVSERFGYYVSNILSGTAGVMADGFVVTANGSPELTVAMVAGGGTITVSSSLKPSDRAGNLVLVGNSGNMERYKTSIFGPQTTISSLAPGDYTIYAWASSRQIEYRDPAVLATLAPYAVSVSIGEGENKEVALKLIPPEAIP